MTRMDSIQNHVDKFDNGSDRRVSAPLINLSDLKDASNPIDFAARHGRDHDQHNDHLTFDNPYTKLEANGSQNQSNTKSTDDKLAHLIITELTELEHEIQKLFSELFPGQNGNTNKECPPPVKTGGECPPPVHKTKRGATGDTSTTPAIPTTGDASTAQAGTPTVVASPGSLAGDNITVPGSKPTSSDAFIANLQMTDPVLAKTLIDSSSHLSADGYKKVESFVDYQYTSHTNWNSGNPNFDSSLMHTALTKQGLSGADQAALTGVLNTDMPAALASDQFLASVQPSDPTMAKVLGDASSQLSKSGYYSLESFLKSSYSGNPNESIALPNQTFLDNVLLNRSLGSSKLNQADQNALTNVLKNDMPGATAKDLYLASVQETGDNSLAKVLTSGKSNLSARGYTQLETYLEENSTWKQKNDGSLLNQALSQGGLGDSDRAALLKVLQSEMPSALTDKPSPAVLQEMAQARFNYLNAYSLRNFNHPSAIDGNPGKAGTLGTKDDQQPANVVKMGPWAAITPMDPNSYDKNAVATISNPTMYYHLKTGGWVKASTPHNDASANWWEGHYNNSFTANARGDQHVNADGSVSFSAPPSDMPVDHFGTNTLPYDQSLYNGVYESMQARVNVDNSGLAMNLGADYFQSKGSPSIRQGAMTNWVPLTTTDQTLYLTDMPMSAIEADPPPGH